MAMKSIFILLVLIVTNITVNAQGMLRSIIFADTNDDKIGDGVQCNLDVIQEEIDKIASCIGMENMTAAPLIYEQFDCTPQKLRECMKGFRCGTDDIVMFFYFGHGGRSPYDRSEFPQMCLGTDISRQEEWIPLEDVKNMLMKQNPRLCIVYGDLCNSADSDISPKYGVLTSASASEFNETQKVAMRKLFLESRGSIITSGSTKTEYSWYCNVYPDGGGFFTTVFLNELENYTSSTKDADWETIMKKTRDGVVSLTESLKSRNPDITTQTPRFIVDIKYNKQLDIKTNREEENKIINNNNNKLNNDNNVMDTSLKNALVDLANESNTPSYRIKKSPSVLSMFSNSNVWVDIVGRNNKTIVSSERAADFVSRVATAFHLKNFTILDCQRDTEGKVTTLKIHEIYEK